MGIGYAETQAYLDHFRNHGCDSQIINNTAGLFNLCFYMAGTIDQLCEELKKKQVNIIRLQQLVFGLRGQADEAPDEPDGDEAESKASTSSQPEAGHGERSSPTSQSEHQTDDNPPSKPGHDPKKPPPGDEKKKPKGHGRYGIDAYTGAQTVHCECEHQPGDPCPQCHLGRVGKDNREADIQLQIDGHAPLGATRYRYR